MGPLQAAARGISALDGRGVIIERTLVQGLMRVSAIDEQTGIEAIVFAHASTPPAELDSLALRKLEKLLTPPSPETPPRRGKLV